MTGLALRWRDCLAGIEFSRIYSSDLTRARETAGLLAQDRPLEVTVRTELREIYLGDWENRPFSEIQAIYPHQWTARGLDLSGFRPPGGESFADVEKRVLPLMADIIAKESANVLLVSHAGVNRVILCRMLGMEMQHLFSFHQDPAGLNLIDADSSPPRVAAVNLSAVTLRQAGIDSLSSSRLI